MTTHGLTTGSWVRLGVVVRLPKLSLVVRTWVSEAVKSSRLGSSRLLGCGGGSVSPRSVGAIAHRRMGIWRTPRVVPVRRALAPSLARALAWRVAARHSFPRLCGMRGSAHRAGVGGPRPRTNGPAPPRGDAPLRRGTL